MLVTCCVLTRKGRLWVEMYASIVLTIGDFWNISKEWYTVIVEFVNMPFRTQPLTKSPVLFQYAIILNTLKHNVKLLY